MKKLLLVALICGATAVAQTGVGEKALSYASGLGSSLQKVGYAQLDPNIGANQKIAVASIKKNKFRDAADALAENEPLLVAERKESQDHLLQAIVKAYPDKDKLDVCVSYLQLAETQNSMALATVYRKLGSDVKAAKLFQKVIAHANTKNPKTAQANKAAVQDAKVQLKAIGY